MAGQSQATTFGMSLSTLPFSWQPDPDVLIWVRGQPSDLGRWEVYAPGLNSAPRGQWGPELALSAGLRRESPKTRLFIIKHAPGQTGAAFDTRENDWSPLSKGEAWDRLRGMVDAALKTCVGRVDTIFWMGNHSDGMRADKAGDVGTNMKALIDLSRSEWGQQINWVIGIPDDTAPFSSIVQDQIRYIAKSEKNVITFETAHYETQDDALHYNAKSVMNLGEDFLRALNSLIEGKKHSD